MKASPEVQIRVATPADHDEIVDLAGTALGWDPAEPNAELFRWKHLEGPLGPSPMWVAEVDGRLGAFRCFLRWQLDAPDGRLVHAVRPVDTATRPELQGQGLFRSLTTHAVRELDAAVGHEVAVAFNTPNAQSRPGYLSMGWQLLGRLPVAVAVRSPLSFVRLARARVPASKWSTVDTSGLPAADVLADTAGVAALLAAQPRVARWSTHRTPEWLAWRYGRGPMAYRAALRSNRVEDGLVLYRTRRRGSAVEATIGEVLVPGGASRLSRPLLARVLRDAQPDYAIRTSGDAIDGRFVVLPGQGPRLVWRSLDGAAAPALADLALSLGDIESL